MNKYLIRGLVVDGVFAATITGGRLSIRARMAVSPCYNRIRPHLMRLTPSCAKPRSRQLARKLRYGSGKSKIL